MSPTCFSSVAVLLLLAVQPLKAQFSDKVTTTPILIQDGFGPAGDQLPYSGGEYCCPTSVSMSMLYLCVNGFNQIGPSNPTSADGLNLVRIMSGLMGTGATTGTTSNAKFFAAFSTYLNSKGISSADFTLTTYVSPTLAQLASINQPGTTVDLITGDYVPSGDTYVRASGHCVALLNQGIDAQGHSSANTLVINNPLPGVLAPPSDVPGNGLEYLNTVATTGSLTADGSLSFDHNQFPGYWGAAQDVIESAYALTVNPSQQSANHPALAPWTISTTQQLGPNGGNYSVLAPIQGAGGISQNTWGTVELENTDTSTGTNSVIAGTLRSDIASGRPFGTGTIQLQEGTLQLMPTAGMVNVSLAAADASGNQITFTGGCALALNRNGNNSLALQFGGNSDGTTANLARSATGTLVIVPGSGNANLGTSEQIIINGAAANLPTVTNDIVPPYIVSEDNDGNFSGDFVTYGPSGFTRAVYVQDLLTPITSTTATTVYRVQSGQSVPSGTTTSVYAINVNSATVSGGNASTLNVGPQAAGQAGVILNGGTISITNLNFGPAEGLVYTNAVGGTINSVIQGTGGLTTFGPGALLLKGNNTFSGTTNINSGSLVAVNTAGSATGNSAVKVQQNGTLEVRGASANVGSAAGTTVNFGGTLLLSGGTVSGPLSMNFGSYLFGQGTVNGAAGVFGTIGSSATDFGAAPFAGVENITFTGTMATSINTIYDWRLNALDANPADAGVNWSLLKFTGPNNASNQIDLGTSGNPIHFSLDFGTSVPDPNSGNAFWNTPHQWDAANATNGFSNIFYYYGFPTFAAGAFSVSVDGSLHNIYVNFTPQLNNWNLNANGNWTNPGNWNVFVPNSVNAIATFGPIISTPRTVTLDAPQIAGILNFTSPIAYTIAGTNPLTLIASGGQAAINVSAGNHTISVPIVFASSTTVTTAIATGLSFTGPLTIAAGNTITLSGGGSVTLAGTITAGAGSILNCIAGAISFSSTQHLAGLTVSSAAVVTVSPSSPRNVIMADSLSVTGSLNLTNNDLVVHNGVLSTINTQIAQGRGAGSTWWTGTTGITSSFAAATPGITALGVELNDDGAGGTLMSTFEGQTVTSTDVLVKYTFVGDTDLSGTVTAADYISTDNGFNSQNGPAPLTGWTHGDFNYDGVINGDDYTLIDNAFNTQGSMSFAGNSAGPAEMIAQNTSVIAVPEPGSLGLVGFGAIAFLRRRGRRS